MSPTAAIEIASPLAGRSFDVCARATKGERTEAPQPADTSAENNKAEILSLIRVNRTAERPQHPFGCNRKHTIMPAELATGKFIRILSA